MENKSVYILFLVCRSYSIYLPVLLPRILPRILPCTLYISLTNANEKPTDYIPLEASLSSSSYRPILSLLITSQDFFTKSYYVYIINGLPDNTFVLKFRCQSKDDDLGTRFLRVGEDFHRVINIFDL